MAYQQFLESAMKALEQNWQAALSALVGTFLGAYLAFLFQRRYSERRELEATHSAAVMAQFAVAAQLQAARNIETQVLEPKRADPDRHLSLPPFTVHTTHPRLNLNSLTFLLAGEDAPLLNELMLAEQRFDTLIGALKQRNVRHENMQRAVANFGEAVGLDIATETILRDMTNSLYGCAEDARKSLTEVSVKLEARLRHLFPKVQFLKVK